MIKEAYCSFEVCKLLKEKGFPQHITSHTYFVGDNKKRGCIIGEFIGHPSRSDDVHLIDAPTHQMAMAWLREIKEIIIIILHSCNTPIDYGWCFAIQQKDNDFPESIYTSYEEAVEAALKYSLENLI